MNNQSNSNNQFVPLNNNNNNTYSYQEPIDLTEQHPVDLAINNNNISHIFVTQNNYRRRRLIRIALQLQNIVNELLDNNNNNNNNNANYNNDNYGNNSNNNNNNNYNY